ncbi:carboxymuconolactone decarboxylase [Mycolicibacterium duvalii]|uniref:Carboxymuconolactone decarboxylase n=1 Tax=Mycolicibacterium duvalii TaxID=39688 RepID=A0A7I7JWG5_9MYCO|nr:carboxymuconolactone decarboxylase family protein [Mycolicibacterium duvalii]MCV7370029.1 carboxymuconolactone decarboxylase family protein [Mycolicibacterium duvalii]PEG40772.1 carboxymuconolactone decarboxylase [Mycolicibacterium duvalii]BBX15634.1 carboxymuconolactone decarboxylase [Mycolicibacterium duvalii]
MTPLPEEQWDDAMRDALSPLLSEDRRNSRDAGNVLATLLRHPDLTRGYLHFNAHLLLNSTLSPRIREVALLRAVHLRGCDYLWDHHIAIAERAGVTAADLDRIRAGDSSDAVDRLVVATVDEIDRSHTLADDTWMRLREFFDERQILDLLFTVGCYQSLAVAVNVLAIAPEHP